MKWKRAILILQISFLLLTFGAVTFYFQYSALKKPVAVVSSDSGKEKNSDQFPSNEEEAGDENSSSEEEEQDEDEDRAFHHQQTIIESIAITVVGFSSAPVLDFKEIHFEVVTPPPQF